MDGWQDGGGDDGVVPLSFLFGGDASWTWGRCVGITGETAIMSKLDALSLHMSPSVSSNPLQSLKLCLVCPSVTRVVWLGVPGKVMASRLAWLSRSLACHSALPLSRAPGGERGEGRPTEAAKVEVLLALCRSLSLCRSLQVTGVWEEPGSWIRTQGRVREESVLSHMSMCSRFQIQRNLIRSCPKVIYFWGSIRSEIKKVLGIDSSQNRNWSI